jgi:hypothetical protein
MYDNYNYPAGADNEMAPWNEPSIPEEDFEITCSQSLSKTVTVTTNNYIPGTSGVDYERDDEGGTYVSPWHDDPDTSDTDWAEEYHSNDYHTPLQLIQLLKQVLENDLKSGIVFKSPKFTQDLINECEGWTEDETEYIEN